MPNKLKNIGITFPATVIFFLLQALIALIAPKIGRFTALHQIVFLLIGLGAFLKNKPLFGICIAGYIAGAEVFWRMLGGGIFWEFSKYAIVLIFMVGIIMERKNRQSLLVLYFLLLLPAVFIVSAESFLQWRKIVSFNMSGPLTILVCGLYFSAASLDKEEITRFLTWFLGPVISMAVVILMGIRKAEGPIWGASSSFAASGQFGPNQVSTVLGVGAFFCIILVLMKIKNRKIYFKIMFLLIALWFFGQGLLTFSRGGVIQAVISTGVFFIFLFKDKGIKNFIPLAILALLILMIATYYILPKLNEITEGKLEQRYEAKEEVGDVKIYKTTGRIELMIVDVKAFRNNLFGVGVGGSKKIHAEESDRDVTTHTEWTRLLAEHGVFGLLALFFLVSWMLKKCRIKKDTFSKAIAFSFAANASFCMFHSAMRLALVGFLIGFLATDLRLRD